MKTPLTLLAASLAAALVTGADAEPIAPVHWQPTWISPAQPLFADDAVLPMGMPTEFRDVTLRQVVRTSLGGPQLRLVFGNEYGRTPLTLGAAGVRIAGGNGQAAAVRFQGHDGIVVPPGARVVSDPVDLPTHAGERLDVDVYLPNAAKSAAKLASFHWDAQEHTLLLPGNAVGRRNATPKETTTARAFLSELWVASDHPAASVVAIGDSITDGNGSSMGLDQRWPDHLARRLAPQGVAVLNAGIAGNRLLHGGWGDAALARLDRDVLSRPGVRAVVVLLGTNDIGFPGSPFAPTEAPVTLAELTGAFRQLVEQAHARGVRVMAGTVPPFKHALQGTPLEGHYSPDKDATRQALNEWIRRAGVFDGVVDFDRLLRDPADPARLDPALDAGDHLHPGDAGYKRMADAIDLRVLLGATTESAAQ
ncbi:SGNH/GDSL hydrolase family protein [Paucibacter sp. R3-3]|uniref:SGNH/GDSL hydrolase family protein n=1 Tax=Roseateles agri TaxID=3098619 RepID=A0ABU5DPT7_9BURK|nr:SGNH/GDSL hydrolase family protein [Paucibacter sp. R3-3]MDY0748303.1 SGNH/GDSL hydrolase family protein [Paucibacter sp. R3-3]